MRRQWCGTGPGAFAALLAPFDPQLHLGVERLPHPAGQGHLAHLARTSAAPPAGRGRV